MFGVALDVKFNDFKLLVKAPRSAIAGMISQFFLLPLMTFLLVLLIKPQPSIALGMMMVAACPGGNISNFISSLAGGNIALSVSLTAFSTLSALLMTPLNLTLWAGLYPPTNALLTTVSLDAFELAKTVILILGIPLVSGMMVRAKNQALAILLKRWLRPISLVIFITFVVVAFLKNSEIFLTYFHYIVYIVFIHNTLAFLTGYSVASLFKLSDHDRKSITIETGIQNSGLGLVLIFAFFDGLGGMAMVAAWWGIWHIISGLCLGSFWAGKNRLRSV